MPNIVCNELKRLTSYEELEINQQNNLIELEFKLKFKLNDGSCHLPTESGTLFSRRLSITESPLS